MVGTVAELWRYPVKSMRGERVDAVDVDARGVHADRVWALHDLELGATTGAKRLPVLLQCSARFVADPPPGTGPGQAAAALITLPDGSEVATGDARVHDLLSDLVGRRVELRALPPVTDRAAYRAPRVSPADIRRQFAVGDDDSLPDPSSVPLRKLAELSRYATPVGSYADAYPMHVLTTASLAAMAALAPQATFDARRFRPGVLVDTPGASELLEHAWTGGTLRLGDAELAVAAPTLRCSMPVRAQDGLGAEPDVLRTISAHAERCLGAYAEVSRPGRIAVGDPVDLVPPRAPSRRRRLTRRAVTSALRTATAAADAVTRPR